MSRGWLAIIGILALLAVLVLQVRCARAADWLEEAWSDETVAETGGPAVTLEADGSAIVVLPVETLAAARKAGLSTKQTVTLFLERWGQHCSDVIDLDQPHAGLKVLLSLSRATELRGLFVTDDEEVPLSIDYMPARRARCIGGEEAPVS